MENNDQPLRYGESGQNMKHDIAHPNPVADTELRAIIAQTLKEKLHLGADKVGVDVQDGHVLLTGEVWDKASSLAIEDHIRELKGVHGITNDLELQSQS